MLFFCLDIVSSRFFSILLLEPGFFVLHTQRKCQPSIEESQFHWVRSIAAPPNVVAVGLGVGERRISHQ